MEAVAAVAVQTAMPSKRFAFPGKERPAGRQPRTGLLLERDKLREVKLSAALDADDLSSLEEIVTARMRVAKGETLYRSGGRFTDLYAIRLGSFKTVLLADDGCEQVAGYHMPGEILGTDGIGAGLHDSEAIALEDSEVCAISFDRLQILARDQEAVQTEAAPCSRARNRARAQDHDDAGHDERRAASCRFSDRSCRSGTAREAIRRPNSCCA